jgi:hypothetical protein
MSKEKIAKNTTKNPKKDPTQHQTTNKFSQTHTKNTTNPHKHIYGG